MRRKEVKFSLRVSVKLTWAEHRVLDTFPDSNVGKIRLNFMCLKMVHVWVSQQRTWTKKAMPTKTDEVTFWRLLVGQDSYGTCQRIKNKHKHMQTEKRLAYLR